MKILYVIGSMQVGGAERHLLWVSSALRREGYQVNVFAFQPDGPLTKKFQENGIQVLGFRPPNWLTHRIRHERIRAWVLLVISSVHLFTHLWRLRPKVVHFFLPVAYIIGGLVSLFAPPCRRIMSRRSMNHYQSKHRLFSKIERWLHPRMDLVAGNSKAVVAQLVEEGVPPEKARLIYNGIDVQPFKNGETRSATREALGAPEDTLVIVMVANLIPYKGHADLIKALSMVEAQIPQPIMLLLVGRDDGILSALEEQALALKVRYPIRFLGSRTDIPHLMAASDIGVLCSHEEGFSNAVLEGMAAGLPMIVTDVGGNAEAVIHEEHGYVVPPHAPAALGEALLRVIRDKERACMGERGRRRVEEHFSMSACIDAYKALYREAGTSHS